MSASQMFAFLSSGFPSRSSLTGARVFAFDSAHVCLRENSVPGRNTHKKNYMLWTFKG